MELTDRSVEDFLREIELVCKRHGISISHEDEHGSFILEEYDEYNMMRLCDAKNQIDSIE